MGSGCTRNTNATKIEETVLTLPQYKSNSESIFKSFDEKFNYLQAIPLNDFLLSMSKISKNNNGTNNKSIFNIDYDIDMCTVYFKNTIAGHPIFYEKADEKANQIFVEYMTKELTYIQKGAKSFMKKKETTFDSSVIKKEYLLILGLLNCYSSNKGKVDTLFSWICNKENKIQKTIEIELFFYLLIFTPTYANYLSCIDLQKNYNGELPTIDLKNREKYDPLFKPAKVEEAFNEFIGKFFDKENEMINYDEFLKKIASQDLAWILTPIGIRSKFN